MAELNTLSPMKWSGNYGGAEPLIDTTDAVHVGDIAIDTSTTPYTSWTCTNVTNNNPTWFKTPSRHANGAFIEGNIIHGRASLALGHYTGNATARDIDFATYSTIGDRTLYPHFAVTKPATAVLGCLWNYMGGCKGSAAVNTPTNIFGATATGDGLRIGTGPGANTNAAAFNFFALGAHDGCLTGMKAKVGQYTGDATNPHAITVGFQPDVVIVKGEGLTSAVFRTSDTTIDDGTKCEYFVVSTATLATQGIVSLDADGFTVGTATVVNSNTVKYNWLAMKLDAAGRSRIAVTKYTGMVGDGINIPLPWAPDAAFLIPAGALGILFWTNAMTARSSGYVSSATANITDGIIASDSYGLRIGTGTEANTVQNPATIMALWCDGNH